MATERDPFAASRLPDLPISGYATHLERETTDAVMFFMRGVERDRLWLLKMVLDGRTKFRRVMGRKWRGLAIDTDLVDAVFDYFVMQASMGGDIRSQYEQLAAWDAEGAWTSPYAAPRPF